jgi:hypothetical protein
MQWDFDARLETAREELARLNLDELGISEFMEQIDELASLFTPSGVYETLALATEMSLANRLFIPLEAEEAIRDRILQSWKAILVGMVKRGEV